LVNTKKCKILKKLANKDKIRNIGELMSDPIGGAIGRSLAGLGIEKNDQTDEAEEPKILQAAPEAGNPKVRSGISTALSVEGPSLLERRVSSAGALPPGGAEPVTDPLATSDNSPVDLAELEQRQQMIEKFSRLLVDTLDKIRATPEFQACSPEQQLYIVTYVKQMVEGGDKPEFAIAVGKDMALLYQQKIDEKLPREIKMPRDPGKFVTYEKNDEIINPFQEINKAVLDLREIMEENGGDYKLIDYYFYKQMNASTTKASEAMRYFLLTQRQDADSADDIEKNYYLGFHNENYDDLDSENFEEIPRKCAAELEAKFKKVCKKHCEDGGQEKYARTVAMHRAFTAIALNKIDFPGKHPETCSVTVFRVMSREGLCQADPQYPQKAAGGTVTMRHNVAESTSIGGPTERFGDIHEFNVPFSRISAPYFLHSFGSNPMKNGKSAYKNAPARFWVQRELVCNLQGIPAKITQN
jgi:hypothetical protein